MTATVETETKENVLAVPIQSVTTRMPKEEQNKPQEEATPQPVAQGAKPKKENKSKEVVFVFDNGQAKMVSVKRGISDDSYVEIMEGLEEGKDVISGSYKAISRELEDGSKVRVEKAGTKPVQQS